jgi:hypothetical protein
LKGAPGLFLNSQGRLFIQYWHPEYFKCGSRCHGELEKWSTVFWSPRRINTGVDLSIDTNWNHLVFFVDPTNNQEVIKIFLNGSLEFEIDAKIRSVRSHSTVLYDLESYYQGENPRLDYNFGKAGIQIGGSHEMYIQDFKLIQNQHAYYNVNSIQAPTKLSDINHTVSQNWDFNKDFTIDTWIKPSEFNGNSTIFKIANKLMGDPQYQRTLAGTDPHGCGKSWCVNYPPALHARIESRGYVSLEINAQGNLIFKIQGAKGYNANRNKIETYYPALVYNVHQEYINEVTNQGKSFSHKTELEINKWQHISINRSNDILYIYINGEKYLSKALDLTLFFSSPDISIGSNFGQNGFNGELQDLRIINKENLYCGSYHQQKLELTKDSCQGKDLTCPVFHLQSKDSDGSQDFIDISQRLHFIINSGNTAHSSSQTKFSNTSVFFNGIDNSLEVSDTKDFNLQKDFAIEFWINKDGHVNAGSIDYIFNIISGTSSISSYSDEDNKVHFAWNEISLLSTSLSSGWNHIAITSSNNLAALYVNGVYIKTYYIPIVFSDNLEPKLYIGSKNNLIGLSKIYIQDFRIINDINNLSTLIPPTELRAVNCGRVCPDLLIQSDNPDGNNVFSDFSLSTKNIITHGDVVHLGEQSITPIIGSSSMYFPGNDSSYLSIDYNPSLKLEGDFIIELWINLQNGIQAENVIIESFETESGPWRLLYDPVNKSINFIASGDLYILKSENESIENNQWYHIAFQSNQANASLFINGNVVDSTDLHGGFIPREQGIVIGKNLNGYLQDIRIINDEILYSLSLQVPLSFHKNCFPDPLKPNCDEVALLIQADSDEDDFYDKSGNNSIISEGGQVELNNLDKVVNGKSINFTNSDSDLLAINSVYRETLNLNLDNDFTIETQIKYIPLEGKLNQILLYNIQNNVSVGEPLSVGDYIIGIEEKESKHYIYIILKDENTNKKYHSQINDEIVDGWFNLSIVNINKEIIIFINGERLAAYEEVVVNQFIRSSSIIMGGNQEMESYCSILKIESDNNHLNNNFIDSGKDSITLNRSDEINTEYNSPIHVNKSNFDYIDPLFGNSSIFFDNRIDKSGAEDVAISSFIECETEALGLDNWSIDFWINPITWEGNATLIFGENFRIGKKDKNSNQLTIEIIGVTHLIEDLPDIDSLNWTHIAFTYYQQELKCYINGSLKGTPYSGSIEFGKIVKLFGDINTPFVPATDLEIADIEEQILGFNGYVQNLNVIRGIKKKFLIDFSTELFFQTNSCINITDHQYPFNGLIQDFRIVKGKALYRGNYVNKVAQLENCIEDIAPIDECFDLVLHLQNEFEVKKVFTNTSVEKITVFTELSNGNWMVGTGGDPGDAKIYKSLDFGSNWELVTSFSGKNTVHCITEIDSTHIAVGLGDGEGDGDIYKLEINSDAELQNKTQVFDSNFLNGGPSIINVITKLSNGDLLAGCEFNSIDGTITNIDLLLMSVDSGDTWSTVSQFTVDKNTTAFKSIKTIAEIKYADNTNHIYIGTGKDKGIIYRAQIVSNGNYSWDTNSVIGESNFTKYQSFTQIQQFTNNSILVCGYNDELGYADLLRSIDEGLSFSKLFNQKDYYGFSQCLELEDDKVLLASIAEDLGYAEVLYSTNGGRKYSTLYSDPEELGINFVQVSRNNIIIGTNSYIAKISLSELEIIDKSGNNHMLENTGKVEKTQIKDTPSIYPYSVDWPHKKWGPDSRAGFKFDGKRDVLYTNDEFHEDWDLGSEDFTIDGWFQIDAFPPDGSEMAILDRADKDAVNGDWKVYCSQNQLRFTWIETSGAEKTLNLLASNLPSENFHTNQWYHFAVSRVGDIVRGFIDGRLCGRSKHYRNSSKSHSGLKYRETCNMVLQLLIIPLC